MEKEFKKVNFADYEDKYDNDIIKQLKDSPKSVDVEAMRKVLYGYTFTKGYREGDVHEELFMDYWNDQYMKKILQPGYVEEKEETEDDLDFDSLLSKLCDYEVNTPQERLLLQAIDSTGDGRTPETALSVIDVHQEYEYIHRVFPFMFLRVKRQKLLPGNIDCLEFEKSSWGISCIYFDISRKFEVSK